MALGNYLASPKTLAAKLNLEKIGKDELKIFLRAGLNRLPNFVGPGAIASLIEHNNECNKAVKGFTNKLVSKSENLRFFIKAMKNQANSTGTKRNGNFFLFVKNACQYLDKEANASILNELPEKTRNDNLKNLKKQAKSFITARITGQNGGSILAQAKSKRMSSKLKLFMAMVTWLYSKKQLGEIEKRKKAEDIQQQTPPKLPEHMTPPVPPPPARKQTESGKPEKVLFYNTKGVTPKDLRGVFSTIGGKETLIVYPKMSNILDQLTLSETLYQLSLVCNGKKPTKNEVEDKGLYVDLKDNDKAIVDNILGHRIITWQEKLKEGASLYNRSGFLWTNGSLLESYMKGQGIL